MEGPSLFLAAEQLQPFVGKQIKLVEGNTKIGKERLEGKKILSIFSYGKYLFFQFDTFALRVHFMLFGSFEAVVNNIKVTGDYPRKNRPSRLSLIMKIGRVDMYSCSLRYIEHANAKELCDYTTDIMSEDWDEKKALGKVLAEKKSEIADVLLDQTIFLGIGNIIKNEVLLLAKVSPVRKIEDISLYKLKRIISLSRKYVFDFYRWRKNFELRKHYQIYRQKVCKLCGSTVVKKWTGERNRVSYICPHCEK